MKPRKPIAVLGATENEASLLALVLDVRGYCVVICSGEDAAMRIETPAAFLLVGYSSGERLRVESRLWLQHRKWAHAAVSHRPEKTDDAAAWMADVMDALTAALRKPRADAEYRTAKESAAGAARRTTRNRRYVA